MDTPTQETSSWILEVMIAGDVTSSIKNLPDEFGLYAQKGERGYAGCRIWLDYQVETRPAISLLSNAILETPEGIYNGTWTYVVASGSRKNMQLVHQTVRELIGNVSPIRIRSYEL